MSYSLLGGSNSTNTGIVQGAASKGIVKNLAIFGGAFTASDTADATSVATALTTYSLKPKSDTSKLFWLPEAQNIEDKSESDKEGSLNLGFKTILVEGKPAYEIRVFGDSEFAINLRKFNGKIVNILEFDSNRKLWGAKKGSSVVGYQAKVQTKGQKAATGQNVEEGVVTFTVSFLSTSEYFDSPKYIDLGDVDTSEIHTQVDAELAFVSKVDNVYKIGIGIPTAKANTTINVYERFADELAVGALWVAKTGEKFTTSLAITGVEKDDSLGCWAITFDATAYAALASGAKIKLYLVDPAALVDADVLDTESVPVILTK